MDLENRITKLEQSVEGLKKQIQNINNVLMEAVRITTILEKAAKIIAPPTVVIKPDKIPDDLPPVIKVEEPVVIKPDLPEEPVVIKPDLPEEPIVEIKPVVKVDEQPMVIQVTDDELVNLLKSDKWPVAIDPAWIGDANSEQDKQDKAEGILDMIIDIHLENLKFLDFGCGEGYVLNKCRSQNPKLAVGYDIKYFDKWDDWEQTGNVIYTDSWQTVYNAGPYNVVLMYDVIDHILVPEPQMIARLKEVKSLLAPNGRVYVRCHPWTSRHGTHLYREINKAYVHMIFTEEELSKMGYHQEEVRKFKHPLTDYNNLWNKAGFKIVSGPHQLKEGVDPFFKTNPLKTRIQEHYKDSIWEVLRSGAVFPSDHMENQFIDYILG